MRRAIDHVTALVKRDGFNNTTKDLAAMINIYKNKDIVSHMVSNIDTDYFKNGTNSMRNDKHANIAINDLMCYCLQDILLMKLVKSRIIIEFKSSSNSDINIISNICASYDPYGSYNINIIVNALILGNINGYHHCEYHHLCEYHPHRVFNQYINRSVIAHKISFIMFSLNDMIKRPQHTFIQDLIKHVMTTLLEII